MCDNELPPEVMKHAAMYLIIEKLCEAGMTKPDAVALVSEMLVQEAQHYAELLDKIDKEMPLLN
ncbi:MAG: hypothetical protein IKF51_06405 [Solobacterium sp.]|nr:hypothetical protein [Solobacterium sp.]